MVIEQALGDEGIEVFGVVHEVETDDRRKNTQARRNLSRMEPYRGTRATSRDHGFIPLQLCLNIDIIIIKRVAVMKLSFIWRRVLQPCA